MPTDAAYLKLRKTMKKKILAICAALTFIQAVPANAHVGAISYGNTLVAGQSSRIFLSLGHGCTYKNVKYGTSIFQVDVPATAGKPTPAYVPGFKVTNVASKDLLANGAPKSYRVTWIALAKSKIVPDGTFRLEIITPYWRDFLGNTVGRDCNSPVHYIVHIPALPQVNFTQTWNIP